jgi:hypothetical protein
MLGAVLAMFLVIGFAVPASEAQLLQNAPGLEIQQGRFTSITQAGAPETAATAPLAQLPPHNLLGPIGEATSAQADADAFQGAAAATTRTPAAGRFHAAGTNPVSPGPDPANLPTMPLVTSEPGAPVRGTSFTDMVYTESFFFPPDVTMAAGPNDLLTASNGRAKIFLKNGMLRSTSSLDAFFGTTNSFDPWAVYDPYIQRFWLFAVNQTDPSTSTYLIALSTSSEANDGFTTFSLDARAFGNDVRNDWCDYPKLGIDSQAIYLTCNMWSLPNDATTTFQTSKIRVMSKSQFVTDTCCSWWDFWNISEGTRTLAKTIQPAVMIGANNANGEFLVAAQGQGGSGNVYEVYHITNAQNCCFPTQTGPGFAQAARSVGSYSQPPLATQPSGALPIDTIGATGTGLLYALWQNGKLASGQSFACGSPAVACIAFDEFDVSAFPTITTLNDWFLPSAGHAYYPMVAANSAGNRTMVYSRSSATEFAGARFVGIPPTTSCTGCFDGPETALAAGQNTYARNCLTPVPVMGCTDARNRWGDYSGASPDPDGTGVWIRGEYASATQDQWATQIGLTYEAAPRAAPHMTMMSGIGSVSR